MSPDLGPANGSAATSDRLYLDTTVLASLASVDLVGTVPATIANPRTSYAVRGELDAGVAAGYDSLTRALAWLRDPLDTGDEPGIAVAGSLVRQRKPELLDRLGTSDASVLYQAWAADAPLATDDRDVRAVAASYGVPVTGSLGIVAHAVERGALSAEAADDALVTWRTEGQTVPVDGVADLLSADG
jgi:predicted nucleic acid-binding protein